MFRRFQIEKFNSKRMVPSVTMMINVNASNMIKLRREANNCTNIDFHITITHIVMKAVANTLINFSTLYSFFDGTKIINNPELVLNIPVDNENHVEYITVYKPNSKTLTEISKECGNELKKIRNNEGEFINYLIKINKIPLLIRKLYMLIPGSTLDFMRKHYGNFVISNFGSFNIAIGSLAISQPIIAALCIGAISPTLSISNYEYITTMNLPISLSFDHRAVDGAYVGKFLNEVKKLIESPESLFIG